jgi:ubiquinol-cytochrome c reductase cytochrome b subunit
MAVVLLLVYRMPILNKVAPDVFTINENLPREAMLGVHLGAPADPASFYDAARPEWSFRSIYHFVSLKIKGADGIETDVFPGEKKYIPVFVVTSCIAVYIFLIPVIGRLFVGHCLNILVVAALFVSICYLTYASYHHDYFEPSMQSFRDDEAAAARQAERAIELCLSSGIPPTGALTLLQTDPFTQGPILYKQHCAICHPFSPQEGTSEHPDFRPIPCDTPKAPNLYNPIRKEWIAGFLDPQKINSADYFANTKFVAGSMSNFVRRDMQDVVKEVEEDMGTENALDRLVDFLLSEAKRESPRGPSETVSEEIEEINGIFSDLTCSQCHFTYDPNSKPAGQAPDLRGYLSRDWLIGIISDPESKRFYGPPVAGKSAGNDAMPAYHKNAEEAVMSMEEIGILTDWLRENWHRYRKVTPTDASMQPVE